MHRSLVTALVYDPPLYNINKNPPSPNTRNLIKLRKPGNPISPMVNWKNTPAQKLGKYVFKKLPQSITFLYTFNVKNTSDLFLNVNQLDALNFIINLFQASTFFEHMCSSSGGQNCIIQSLVSSHL